MSKGLTEEAIEFFRKHGRRGGKIGGKARMEKLSPAERQEIARKGGQNRWKGQNGIATAHPTPSTSAKKHDPKPKKAKGGKG